jgi:hypothetical protein
MKSDEKRPEPALNGTINLLAGKSAVTLKTAKPV